MVCNSRPASNKKFQFINWGMVDTTRIEPETFVCEANALQVGYLSQRSKRCM